MIALLLHYKYFLIIPLAVAEGPILSIICGFFIKLGYFDFWPLYFSLMAGDMIGDVLWYCIGYYFGHPFIKRFGKYFNVTESGVKTITEVFHRYKNSILIISKITTGFGFALVVLITAGIVKIPFKRYFILNLVGQFFWTALLIGIGFFFGNLYNQATSILEKVSTIGLIIFIFLCLAGIMMYIKKLVKQKLINKQNI